MEKISDMIEGLGKLCTGLSPLDEEIRSALELGNFESVSNTSEPQ
jgi:hypothetical protein